MPTLELIALVIDVVHLRQAGVPRMLIEDHLVQSRHMARPDARLLINQVEHELQDVRHRQVLPLAVSAEALLEDCVKTRAGIKIRAHN